MLSTKAKLVMKTHYFCPNTAYILIRKKRCANRHSEHNRIKVSPKENEMQGALREYQRAT